MTPAPTSRRPGGTPEGGRFAAAPRSEVVIRLEDLDRCSTCDGDGSLNGSRCPACQGTGSLDADGWDRHATVESRASVACTDCEDGVTTSFEICVRCDGTGSVKDYSTALGQ